MISHTGNPTRNRGKWMYTKWLPVVMARDMAASIMNQELRLFQSHNALLCWYRRWWCDAMYFYDHLFCTILILIWPTGRRVWIHGKVGTMLWISRFSCVRLSINLAVRSTHCMIFNGLLLVGGAQAQAVHCFIVSIYIYCFNSFVSLLSSTQPW